MINIILDVVILALWSISSFLWGMIYENKFGYSRKELQKWRKIALINEIKEDVMAIIENLEKEEKKMPDGSIKSPFQIKKD